MLSEMSRERQIQDDFTHVECRETKQEVTRPEQNKPKKYDCRIAASRKERLEGHSSLL